MDDDELQRARRPEPTGDASSEPGPAGFPARVTSTGAALAVGNYVLMQPFTVTGAPVEGGAATLNDAGPPVAVYWVGTKTPATGDQAVVRRCGNRWVAEKKAGGGGSGVGNIPGCACTDIPGTLHMSATGPCGDGTFPGATFVYGPTPPEFSGLDLGANCFLSAETYTDAYSGGSYRFHLGCDTIFFRLSRVYMADGSEDSFAFHDATIYAWSIGQPGNTCHPFLLSSGTIYSGGNPFCIVVVTE